MKRLWVIIGLLWACDDGGSAAQEGATADVFIVADAAVDAETEAPDPDMAGPDAAPVDAAGPDAEPMAGEPPAEPMPYSGGECPTFRQGRNTFSAAGRDRVVDLYVPDDPRGAPLLFMWHPLNSNARQIANFLGANAAADARGMIIAVPESLRTQTEWGFIGDAGPDLAVFDDLLSCLSEQYGLDRTRVYTTGFSAGALWSSYLVLHRAEFLTAAVILSGGINNFVPYRTPAYRLPVLLAWGGPTDTFGGVINFQETTFALRDALRADGHTVVMCGHRGGHVPPSGVASWGYDFMELHAVRDGMSPLDDGVGPPFPEICNLAD